MKILRNPEHVMSPTKEDILSWVEQIKENLRDELTKLNTSRRQMIAFERYISVFHPHFIVWVAGMQNSCVTARGKYASIDNISLEITEEHQQMLWDFMDQMNIKPNIKAYQRLFPAIEGINSIMTSGVKYKNGTGPSAVIYLLEELGKVYIPWMEEVAKKHKVKKLTYTKKHGLADEKHAQLAFDAFYEELEQASTSGVTLYYNPMREAFKEVQLLLDLIFSLK